MIIEQVVGLARQFAPKFSLDPVLVTAICEQESEFDNWAIRPESKSGFKERYGAAYHGIIERLRETVAEHWIQFDDVFYCSYGLMQTMYPVVLETIPDLGRTLKFPTELCEPVTGIVAGCRIFASKLAGANDDTRLALLHWNGGRNPAYPEEVLRRADRIRAAVSSAK